MKNSKVLGKKFRILPRLPGITISNINQSSIRNDQHLMQSTTVEVKARQPPYLRSAIAENMGCKGYYHVNDPASMTQIRSVP